MRVDGRELLQTSAFVKDYSTPAIEQELTALDRRPGQVLDNTQGRKPRGRGDISSVIATVLWGFEELYLGLDRWWRLQCGSLALMWPFSVRT